MSPVDFVCELVNFLGWPPAEPNPREALRARWDPPRRLLRCIRQHKHWSIRGGPVGRLACRFYAAQHRRWSIVCGCDVPLDLDAGAGLVLDHPRGIVIDRGVQIGHDVTICGGAMIRAKQPGGAVPTIGTGVEIGAGAIVLGGIDVRPYAKIGAGALVLEDVPQHATVVSVAAARLVKREVLAACSDEAIGFLTGKETP